MKALHALLDQAGDDLTQLWLPIVVGIDQAEHPVVADLANMPHLLIGGRAGSGKTVAVRSMVATLLLARSPDEFRVILIDPRGDVGLPDDTPHLLRPVVTDPIEALDAFRWCSQETKRRFESLKATRTRDIDSYNRKVAKSGAGDDLLDHLPRIVVVIDGLVELMLSDNHNAMDREITRLGQKSRAAGIHLVVTSISTASTVVTNRMLTSLQARMAFRVVTTASSLVLLDKAGAEDLDGPGEGLLLMPGKRGLTRVMALLTTDDDLRRVCEQARARWGEPTYIDL